MREDASARRGGGGVRGCGWRGTFACTEHLWIPSGVCPADLTRKRRFLGNFLSSSPAGSRYPRTRGGSPGTTNARTHDAIPVAVAGEEGRARTARTTMLNTYITRRGEKRRAKRKKNPIQIHIHTHAEKETAGRRWSRNVGKKMGRT